MSNVLSDLLASEPNHRPRRRRQPVITQQQLARYRELKMLERTRKSLRKKLLNLLAAGALVEPGRLRVRVRRHESRLLNFKTALGIFTQAELDWIRSALEPTIIHRLSVTPARTSSRTEHEEPTEDAGAPHRVPLGGQEVVRPPEACCPRTGLPGRSASDDQLAIACLAGARDNYLVRGAGQRRRPAFSGFWMCHESRRHCA
jgi:hypothetical protein